MAGNSVANAQGDELLYGGSNDPRVNPISMPEGSFYIYAPLTGGGSVLLKKLDNGVSTNFEEVPTLPPGESFLIKGTKTIFVIDNGDYTTLQEAIDAAPDGSLFLIGPKTGGWGDITLPQNSTFSFSGQDIGTPLTALIGQINIAPTVGNSINASFRNMAYLQETGKNVFNLSGAGNYNLSVDHYFIFRESGSTDSMIVDTNSNASSICIITNSSFKTFADELGGTLVALSSIGIFRMDSSQLQGGDKCLESLGNTTLITPFCGFQTSFAGPTVDVQAGRLFTGGFASFSNFLANGTGINIAAGATADIQKCIFQVIPGTGFAISGAGTITTSLNTYNGLSSAIEGTITNSVVFGSDLNTGNINLASLTSTGGEVDCNTILFKNATDPVDAQDLATKNYVDSVAHMDTNFSNAVASVVSLDLGGFGINNLLDPVLAQDAATKNYVDTAAGSAMATDFSNAVAAANSIDLDQNNLINVSQILNATATLEVVSDLNLLIESTSGTVKLNSGSSAIDMSDNLLDFVGSIAGSTTAQLAINSGAGQQLYLNSDTAVLIETSAGNIDITPSGNLNVNGLLDMNTNLISNVVDPVSPQDAVTLAYFNANLPSAGASTTLNNLGVTAINADLLFDSDTAYDIGDSTNSVNHIYVSGLFNVSGTEVFNLDTGTTQLGTNLSFVDAFRSIGSDPTPLNNLYVNALRNGANIVVDVVDKQLEDGSGNIVLTWSAGRPDFQNSLSGMILPRLAADPGTPTNGEMWYNTTDDQLVAWVNGAKVVLA